MHWEQSLPIVSSKRNPPLNLNLSMTGNYKCSNNYIELTLFTILLPKLREASCEVTKYLAILAILMQEILNQCTLKLK